VLIVTGANNLLVFWDDEERAGQRSGWWMPDGFELVERPTQPTEYDLSLARMAEARQAEIAVCQELPRRAR